MFIDTAMWIRAVEDRLATTSDEICRRNLQTVIKHMTAEKDGDLEGLMATISTSQPVQYWQWGAPAGFAPSGRDELRAYYADFVKTRRGSHLEYAIDRIVADHATVVTDGVRRSIYSGELLASPNGWPVSNHPVVEATDLYIVTERQITTWPFDDEGLLTGEEGYRVVTEVRRVTPAERAELTEAN